MPGVCRILYIATYCLQRLELITWLAFLFAIFKNFPVTGTTWFIALQNGAFRSLYNMATSETFQVFALDHALGRKSYIYISLSQPFYAYSLLLYC